MSDLLLTPEVIKEIIESWHRTVEPYLDGLNSVQVEEKLKELPDVYENLCKAQLAKDQERYEIKIGEIRTELDTLTKKLDDREADLIQAKKEGIENGIQSVIDYLKNEMATQDERSAGEPRLKAHLNAVEQLLLLTVINALEEGQALKEEE